MSNEAVPHDPQAAVEYMLKTAPRFAKAKAQTGARRGRTRS